VTAEPIATAPADLPPAVLTAHAVRRWLVTRISTLLAVPAAAVHPDVALSELGLSSVQAVQLAADLEDWSGRPIPATFVYEFPTIGEAARHLAALPGLDGARR